LILTGLLLLSSSSLGSFSLLGGGSGYIYRKQEIYESVKIPNIKLKNENFFISSPFFSSADASLFLASAAAAFLAAAVSDM